MEDSFRRYTDYSQTYIEGFIYDLSAFLCEFDWLNMSKLANYLGVNSSQLRYYKKKGAYASNAQRQMIENGLHALAARLSEVSLL